LHKVEWGITHKELYQPLECSIQNQCKILILILLDVQLVGG